MERLATFACGVTCVDIGMAILRRWRWSGARATGWVIHDQALVLPSTDDRYRRCRIDCVLLGVQTKKSCSEMRYCGQTDTKVSVSTNGAFNPIGKNKGNGETMSPKQPKNFRKEPLLFFLRS